MLSHDFVQMKKTARPNPGLPGLIAAIPYIQPDVGLGMRNATLDVKRSFVIAFKPLTTPGLTRKLDKVREVLGIDTRSISSEISWVFLRVQQIRNSLEQGKPERFIEHGAS